MNICRQRGDALGDEKIEGDERIEGAASDLHASEARYHEKCLQDFENPKNIQSAQRDNPKKSPEEYAIRYVVRSIQNQPERIWTSVELHNLYNKKGGRQSLPSALEPFAIERGEGRDWVVVRRNEVDSWINS